MLFRTLLQGLVLIVVLVIIGFVAQRGDLGGVFNQEWIDAHVRGPGRNGALIYLVGAALFVAFGLPRQVVSFLGGYAFGLNLGIFLALAATAMGCLISFFFARFIGRNIVSKRFPKRIKKADIFLKDNTFAMTLLIRLLPLGSNFITNLVAGVSSA
ncbi:MAG: VTT domain-containing protein, partial [Rhodospirillales bacterium]|nr:VTT domain-containing protein [Rhodospirillales bacterium]